MKSTVIEAQRFKAYRRMKLDDAETPRGEDPPVGYLDALDRAEDASQIKEVREAHRAARGPPDFTGQGGGQ